MAVVDPSIVSAASVLAGVVVGIGAPFAAAQRSRQVSSRDQEKELADRILSLWEHGGDLVGTLRDPDSSIRRQLLLLGMRLTDQNARTACLHVVELAGDDASADPDLLNAWTDMVASVAASYRRLARH